jgi:ketosteroid isomerase-like protein
MSAENVEVLRHAAAAVNKKDASILETLLAPGVFWKIKATAPDLVGTYVGIDEVRRWFARWERAWEEWDWHHPEMHAYGDTVLARMHIRARGRNSGIEIEADVWQTWTFRGGKVIYYEDFESKGQALEAVGLSE